MSSSLPAFIFIFLWRVAILMALNHVRSHRNSIQLYVFVWSRYVCNILKLILVASLFQFLLIGACYSHPCWHTLSSKPFSVSGFAFLPTVSLKPNHFGYLPSWCFLLPVPPLDPLPMTLFSSVGLVHFNLPDNSSCDLTPIYREPFPQLYLGLVMSSCFHSK